MQVLVLYFSEDGNTKKLAEKIAQGVEEVFYPSSGWRSLPAGK